jgi:transcriptional regulator with XRE-family HTH domain
LRRAGAHDPKRSSRPGAARPSLPALPVPLLRDVIARETARSSLRRIARELTMSANGLRDFLRGATPRRPTRAKLERWLVGRGRLSRPPDIGQFVRLLNELSGDLSQKQTLQMGHQVADLLIESYTTRGLEAPTWVHDLRRHYESPGAAAGDVA